MFQKQWENLANAIIEQAVEDYRNVVKNLKIDPYSHMALRDKKEIEEFFRSDWFPQLTHLDGKMLLERIQKEAS